MQPDGARRCEAVVSEKPTGGTVSQLELRGVEKYFGGTHALRGVDLSVPEGSLAAVLGPSGCGKTTLLRVIAGFLRPDGGSIALGGRTVAGPAAWVPTERRGVGVVPQEGALFPHLSVAANVGFGLSRDVRRSGRVAELLELVGLADVGDRMPAELSGGQQQRVALARALAPQPALVLLDEPFSALDTGLRASLREDVRRALRATSATALLVTHDQQEALSIADTVAVMREGRVVQVATPADIYTRPLDIGVATFVGEAVVLPAVCRGDRAETALGSLPVRGGAVEGQAQGHVVVRPEQLHLGQPGNGVPAQVVRTTFYGHDAVIELSVQTPGGMTLSVSARTYRPESVRDDALVGVRVEGEALFYPAGP